MRGSGVEVKGDGGWGITVRVNVQVIMTAGVDEGEGKLQ